MDLIHPYTMLVSGCSGAGKTTFVMKLIKETQQLFDHVLIACKIRQEVYDIPGVKTVIGMPEDVQENTLFIIDDMLLDCNQSMASYFTCMRHKRISTIFITQSLFSDNKYLRIICRNSNYLVLFPNPADATIVHTLSRKVFPANPKFISKAFEMATMQNYGYLFLDLKPNVKHRVKDGVLREEEPHIYLHA